MAADYAKAVRTKLRVATPKGSLTVEDLWDLNLSQLNEIAKGLNRRKKNSEEEDFLKVDKPEDQEIKLSFDIVLDILQTKQREAQEAEDRKAKLGEKQMLLALLETKKMQGLASLTEEELVAKIRALEG